MKYVVTIVFVFLVLIIVKAQDIPLLTADEMIKLVPDRLQEFNRTNENKGRTIKIGTLTYSIVEQNFSKQKRKVVILLFDYNNAPIMYSQATKKWKSQPNIENDTLVDRSFVFFDSPGREYYHKFSKSSQLMMGINSRFYLVLRGEGVDLEALRAILGLFPFPVYPGLQRDITDAKHQ